MRGHQSRGAKEKGGSKGRTEGCEKVGRRCQCRGVKENRRTEGGREGGRERLTMVKEEDEGAVEERIRPNLTSSKEEFPCRQGTTAPAAATAAAAEGVGGVVVLLLLLLLLLEEVVFGGEGEGGGEAGHC